MPHVPPHVPQRIAPAEVWAPLAQERQAQIIRLMARLAYNIVHDSTDSTATEVPHVYPQPTAQDHP